ncbi:MAG TPA: hypothetical protein VJ914_17790 [Pseudonocardiaceae bacterium]|nr:hypothetical protein [Pseudonocardiaceae bacterium]
MVIWILFALGIVIILATAISVVGTLVVPRGYDSRISRVSEHAVDLAFQLITRPIKDFIRRDAILAWQSPISLLVRLALWIGLLLVGYALVLTPVVPNSLPQAFAEAGSSMFTLGYAPPTNNSSSALDYVAAYTGLIVVGLQVGYLPTLYSAFNRRETLVTLLVARAGTPAWGPEILARTRWGIYDGDPEAVLNEMFVSWQKWAAEVAESHTTYLTLVRLRSPRPLSHWLTALLSVMDAAALHLSLTPSSQPKDTARLCLRMGFVAMNQIGRAMRVAVNDDPNPEADQISISYADFERAVAMLQELNYPLERTAEQAWPHFRGWRINYDMTALALANALDAPPALWSGSRRFPSKPMEPLRPAVRAAAEGPRFPPVKPDSAGK